MNKLLHIGENPLQKNFVQLKIVHVKQSNKLDWD